METATDLEALVQQLQEELREVRARLERLEPASAAKAAAPAPLAGPEPPREEISEEELTAIAAAVAAYLGVHAHIRQVRLVGSSRWAQEGRVSIQASHRLH